MNILVTGGAGYIGSILCPMLLEKGHKVTIYDNLNWGIRPILHFIDNKNLTIVNKDIRDEKEIESVVKKNDIIIHLAAIVGFPACAMNPLDAKSINIDGTKNIAKYLSKDQHIIFASTGSTYGALDIIATENTPIAPLTLYGLSKAEAEKILNDKGATSLRFATVYGLSPRLRIDLLVNDFTYLAIHKKEIVLFEGNNKRTFMHVRDAVRSILFTLDNLDVMKSNIYNVGNRDLNLTKREVAQNIRKKINFYLHEAKTGEDPDKRDYEVSYDKIYNQGFSCIYDLNYGLDELIKVLPNIQFKSEWRNY